MTAAEFEAYIERMRARHHCGTHRGQLAPFTLAVTLSLLVVLAARGLAG